MPAFRIRKWLNNVFQALVNPTQLGRSRRARRSRQLSFPAEMCEARLLLTTVDGIDDYGYDDSMCSDPMYGMSDYGDAVTDSPMGDDYSDFLDEFDTYTTDAQTTMEESLESSDAAES